MASDLLCGAVEQELRLIPVGSKVKFEGEKRAYTVQASNERFAICTKPFNAQRTVLYTIIDFKRGVRGPDDMIFSGGYETRAECEENLSRLMDVESGMEVSYRSQVALDIEHIKEPS